MSSLAMKSSACQMYILFPILMPGYAYVVLKRLHSAQEAAKLATHIIQSRKTWQQHHTVPKMRS